MILKLNKTNQKMKIKKKKKKKKRTNKLTACEIAQEIEGLKK